MADKEEKDEKVKQKEGAEKRRSVKQSQARGRWVGLIIFLVLFIIGFLLWVGGEMKQERRLDTGSSEQAPSQPSRDDSIIIIE